MLFYVTGIFYFYSSLPSPPSPGIRRMPGAAQSDKDSESDAGSEQSPVESLRHLGVLTLAGFEKGVERKMEVIIQGL